MNKLILLLSSVVRGMFPGISSEEETTETKKCKYCLRRVKLYHYKCPHCRTNDFIFDSS
jgi:hypothetical protein